MKKLSKLFSVLVISCMLLVPLTATASAAGIFSDISAIAQFFKEDITTPEGIRNIMKKIQEGGFDEFISLIGGEDIMEELQNYLNAFESEISTRPTEPATEEEPTTAYTPPVETPTQPPVVYPSYQYTPPANSTPATTVAPETTTFEYIPPEQIYTEAFTTTVFSPVVQENNPAIAEESSPLKTVLGAAVLLGSGVVVIVVVAALKKNKI